MSKMQTNIGDLKRQIEDLHSITNANIARLQNLLVIGANFKNLTHLKILLDNFILIKWKVKNAIIAMIIDRITKTIS